MTRAWCPDPASCDTRDLWPHPGDPHIRLEPRQLLPAAADHPELHDEGGLGNRGGALRVLQGEGVASQLRPRPPRHPDPVHPGRGWARHQAEVRDGGAHEGRGAAGGEQRGHHHLLWRGQGQWGLWLRQEQAWDGLRETHQISRWH